MIKELNKTTVEKKELPVKILQFGEGNFLRAFVDWMIDKANEAGVMHHGVVMVQPIDAGGEIKKIFKAQDCMYHVYLEGIKDKQPIKETHLVKSVMDILNPYSEYGAYEKLFLSDELEMIISNTTEAGIRFEEGDDIYVKPPKSYPAKMTALLYERFKKYDGAVDKGLQIVCCELIEDNGSTLKKFVLRHAANNKLGADFENWVNTACNFYDTLVDRIVPGFPRENIKEIQEELGYNDNLVVKGEYFHVWAIGGNSIIKEKLPLDKAGLNVLFMEDIRQFRAKKVRILNGSHTAMVPIGLQMGCDTVMDAFNTPSIEKFINDMVQNEVLPMIDEDPEELKLFAAKILERFYNPYLQHHLKSISLNSLSKWETRDFPTVKDNYQKAGKYAHHAIFSFAALLLLYSGKSEVEFTPNDTVEFIQFIQNSFDKNDVKGWVEKVVTNKEMWTEDFTILPDFVSEVAKDAELILEKGMAEAIKSI